MPTEIDDMSFAEVDAAIEQTMLDKERVELELFDIMLKLDHLFTKEESFRIG